MPTDFIFKLALSQTKVFFEYFLKNFDMKTSEKMNKLVVD